MLRSTHLTKIWRATVNYTLRFPANYQSGRRLGNVANIEYRVMRPEDAAQVRELFYTCSKLEPIAMGLNMEIPRECKPYVDKSLAIGLNNGLSIVAEDKSVSKIVGFGVCVMTTQDNPQVWEYPADDEDCQKLRMESEILEKLCEGLDLFNVFQVDEIGRIKGMGTIREYQQRGIATAMAQKWLDILRQNDVQLFVGESFSEFSRRISEKYGFIVVRELSYKDYIANETLHMSPESPHKSAALVVKRLDTARY